MANVRTGNVIVVDTSAQFDGVYNICAIKYIGAASGTATIKKGSSSGAVMYEVSGTANVSDPDMEIRSNTGIYVTVTNSAKVYIYLC